MFTIIIPTMWRFPQFIPFLKDLVNFHLVDEIIIINNDIERTLHDPILGHEKVMHWNFHRNIFVNPAWNFGVKMSKNNKICLMNDDVIFDLKLFYRIDEAMTPETGVFGLCAGVPEFNQPLFKDGSIDIQPWRGENTLGFGCLMFMHKDTWLDIPPGLDIYYGDNWIFDTNLLNHRTNYLMTNMFHFTPYAVTTSELGGDAFLAREKLIYDVEIAKFKQTLNP